jgi:streptomycin 6-kinase
MELPAAFIQNIRSTFEGRGEKFLADLPALVDEASASWGLSGVDPVPNLSYNFVAFAKRDGENVVLKIGVPHRELHSEMAALKWFDGDGVCKPLETDEEKGFILLERLRPGTMLAELEDDDERTRIALDVMEKLFHTGRGDAAPANDAFIQLTDWFGELKDIRPQFEGGTGPFPKEILERVESFLPGLFADEDIRLIHGDFHHFNILSSDRGWLAIDPKGVMGSAGYEIGPLMLNPWGSLMDWNRLKVQTLRRVDIIHERLGWERERIIQWSLAHAILSAWWDFPHGDWSYPLHCAEVFSKLK